MTTEKKKSHWARQVAAWRASGQSQQEFCRANNLALSTFQYWKKRLASGQKERQGTSGFIELQDIQMAQPLVEVAILDNGELSLKLNLSWRLWG